MKNVTIADVAKQAEVSKSTVSQYLNKRYDYMGEKTKQRIQEAVEKLGYQPNIVARSLKQKATKTIGVIVANILHNFTTKVVRAIEDVCHASDFHTIICNADDDPVKEKYYIEMLRAKQVDGLIIFPTGDNRDLYQKMLDSSYPVVFMDREVEGMDIPSIMLHNEKAAELAVEHFLEKGYRRIGMMTTSLINHTTPRVERVEGYKKALRRSGIPIYKDYIISGEPQSLQTELEELLHLERPPEGILAGNDLVLIEILKYAKQKGVRVPEDLAVIGIDDVSFASFYTPAITTVAQPTFKMGKAGAELLLNIVQKQEETTKQASLRFEPTLMIRDSV
ncbi:transcriptional regulator, LacI family [Halobacillus karajensis]|uniref:Glucose-resistance amylase regulator n=1 Tax=Halobacillus karajensis TaxID=195088 RepID=A0A059NVK9_9BACI|nr:substrate-binding domain-containing protein [Halobacillus karajensis]CDQ18519.1 Glucose-resistance amylase regulator [Halobacillus karajensis]CDQ23409.1 Glucose-resistance amylase regulator [Halobacillus karajensis]CDQ26891.1 Glucose-resistance amylase regulator [Halobacillus karajensis]SEH50455.1 transcriptional regulator, LacI family [Halobacillus karajensis]